MPKYSFLFVSQLFFTQKYSALNPLMIHHLLLTGELWAMLEPLIPPPIDERLVLDKLITPIELIICTRLYPIYPHKLVHQINIPTCTVVTKTKTPIYGGGMSGPEGIRTPDLLSAIEARSQLRYRPSFLEARALYLMERGLSRRRLHFGVLKPRFSFNLLKAQARLSCQGHDKHFKRPYSELNIQQFIKIMIRCTQQFPSN